MTSKRKHVYVLAKIMLAFIVMYIIPFATVITLMSTNYLSLQTGVSALLTLALLYLTAFQVEIALRNSALRELEVQPVLRVKLGKGYVSDKGEIKQVVLTNEGGYPAKMVTVGIVVEPKTNIEEYRRTTFKDMLIPREELTVMDYHDKLKSYEIRLNILYVDVMERERFIMFVKPRDCEVFIPVGSPVNLERGIFIKVLESLAFIKLYIKLGKAKH